MMQSPSRKSSLVLPVWRSARDCRLAASGSVRIVKKITGGLANMGQGTAGAERVGFGEGVSPSPIGWGLGRGHSAFWHLF